MVYLIRLTCKKNIMARQLIERTVQEVALAYMVDYYKWRASGGRIWNKIEVRTLKGKRADGLLAYKKRMLGGIFVASMEAKSFKTLHNIKPRRDTWLWVKNSVYYATLIALGTGAVFAYQMMDTPKEGAIYVANLWVALVLLVALVTRNSNCNRTIDVFKQVLQYPANEQWVSISRDSYMMIDANLRKPFVKVLKARGIGLLIVNSKKQVHLVHKAKRKRGFWGDFLRFYSVGEEIRQFLK